MDYTDNQVALMQRFVDFYRAAPEVITLSDRFCSFPINEQESGALELLTEKGVVEAKGSESVGTPTFYRLSDAALPDIKSLQEQGRIHFR